VTFVDTGFLFALVSSKDEHHARVVELFQTFRNLKLHEHLVTTNHVVAETITLTRKIGHEKATRLGDQLYGEKIASLHWTTPEEAQGSGLQPRRLHQLCRYGEAADSRGIGG
jgi:predicted nucleic acid-binding protein